MDFGKRGDSQEHARTVDPLIHWTDSDGPDPLQEAAFSQDLPAVEFLLSVGHPAAKPSGHETALHQICWHSGDEHNERIRRMVRCLLAAGINPNARNEEGNTPLHEAVAGDGANVAAMAVLLDAGADPNAENNEGQTPLAHLYDTSFDYAEVVPLLLRYGANPLRRDKRGRHALDLARACAAGEEPAWRKEQWAEEGGPPCGWKFPATPGDEESQMLQLLETAARKYLPPGLE